MFRLDEENVSEPVGAAAVLEETEGVCEGKIGVSRFGPD